MVKATTTLPKPGRNIKPAGRIPRKGASPWRWCGVRSGGILGSCSDDLRCCGCEPARMDERGRRCLIGWPAPFVGRRTRAQSSDEGAGVAGRGHRRSATADGRHPAPGCIANWTATRTMLEQNKHIWVQPKRDWGDSASCWSIAPPKDREERGIDGPSSAIQSPTNPPPCVRR